MYRVRISWEDSSSQIGAFQKIENAKNLADHRAGEGFKVFGESGEIVYDPKNRKNLPEITNPHLGHYNITGFPVISWSDMVGFVKQVNPNPQDIDEIAQSFVKVGNRYNIRGDIAFCQSIIETGWFRFDNGTAVTPNQYNYAGLGVTSRGEKGNHFSSIQEGVTAQIQHLFAYATTNELPVGEAIVDQRYHLVVRGSAVHWEDLSMRWAINKNYGNHILAIYEDLANFSENQYAEVNQLPIESIETIIAKITRIIREITNKIES